VTSNNDYPKQYPNLLPNMHTYLTLHISMSDLSEALKTHIKLCSVDGLFTNKYELFPELRYCKE